MGGYRRQLGIDPLRRRTKLGLPLPAGIGACLGRDLVDERDIVIGLLRADGTINFQPGGCDDHIGGPAHDLIAPGELRVFSRMDFYRDVVECDRLGDLLLTEDVLIHSQAGRAVVVVEVDEHEATLFRRQLAGGLKITRPRNLLFSAGGGNGQQTRQYPDPNDRLHSDTLDPSHRVQTDSGACNFPHDQFA